MIGLEQQMKMERFKKLRSAKAAWLPGGLNDTDADMMEVERRKLMSASSYSQRQLQQTGNRPFSAIFKKASMQNIVQEQVSCGEGTFLIM